ncbi:hypothetical protein [Roseicella aquatilis]|uniref:Nucleotidyltransferase family protein n=1 Tax=Roseicella aquatilis TaxID=2527868 RepID=A0A4R4DV74_9PROT|nr:hypothetical protein [Roseicella aquatilis]TCZ64340.1 hypothetical protein EXY23_06740 [Roseicella aquatilis]
MDALELIGRACVILRQRGVPLPILVGGAVVEFDTGSRITSGDFDFVTAHEDAFAEALLAVGFLRENRRGRLKRGFYHPGMVIGVEIVSGQYFEGQADRGRVRILALDDGEVCMAPTEDMIADRLGQWEASRRRDGELLVQATALYQLAESLDEDYLEHRIRQETAGTFGIDVLRSPGP